MTVDIPRVGLLVAGVAAGAFLFVCAPELGSRADAFNSAVLTVFSVLAGIQLAIFALLGAVRPNQFRLGTSINAARVAIWRKRWRQLVFFYCYLFVMVAIILNQAIDFGWAAPIIERSYVAMSFAILVWSLGLPIALSAIQDDAEPE